MRVGLNYCIFTQQFSQLPEKMQPKNLKHFLEQEIRLATIRSCYYYVILRDHSRYWPKHQLPVCRTCIQINAWNPTIWKTQLVILMV